MWCDTWLKGIVDTNERKLEELLQRMNADGKKKNKKNHNLVKQTTVETKKEI